MSASADAQAQDRRVREIFEAALEVEEARRQAVLAARCGEDATLREEVEALIRSFQVAHTSGLLPGLSGKPATVLRPLLEVGSVLDGTYRVLRRIGEGGMGAVYEVAHVRLPGRYAVKVLLREAAGDTAAFQRFKREAEITSTLRHPNIVQVIDFNRLPDGAPYIAMEFLEGEDLATRLHTHGPFVPVAVATIVEQIASALAAAHARGIIHRDLKPRNIVLVPMPGQDTFLAKVVDFGVSKIRTASKDLTRESALVGTPQYMAPEQARSQNSEVNHSTDQFALAVIAFEMLTGRPPFVADNPHAVLYQIINERSPDLDLADVPASVLTAVRTVMDRALSKAQHHRYPSILAFAAALASAARPGLPYATGATLAGASPSAAAAHAPSEETNGEVLTRPPRTRRRGQIVGLLLLGVAAAATPLLVFRGGPLRTPAAPSPAPARPAAIVARQPAPQVPLLEAPKGAPLVTPAQSPVRKRRPAQRPIAEERTAPVQPQPPPAATQPAGPQRPFLPRLKGLFKD